MTYRPTDQPTYRPTNLTNNQSTNQDSNEGSYVIGNLHFPYSKLPFRLFKPTWSSIPEYTAAKNADFEEKFFCFDSSVWGKGKGKGGLSDQQAAKQNKKRDEKMNKRS